MLDDGQIDKVWIDCAQRIGFLIRRSPEAYASSDGRGTIVVGTRDTLDDDDSLAQLILHELCHALVQGEAHLQEPDWGLDNTSDRDDERERACLLLQAHLADGHALRAQLAPTTVWRSYYNEIQAVPLAGNARAAELAREALRCAARLAWDAPIDAALTETARLLRRAGRWAANGEHPVGPGPLRAADRCGGCAWMYGGAGQTRCRRSAAAGETGRRVDPDYPGCALWEPALDCGQCGACCREGFSGVAISARDPFAWRHPELVERQGPRFRVPRPDGRCAALAGREPQAGAVPGDDRYRCRVYADRPQGCRDLVIGSAACLYARQRVGLTV